MGIAELAKGSNDAFLKQGLTTINTAIQDAISKFDMEHPERTAPALARGSKATRDLIAQVEQSTLANEAKYNVSHELRVKEQQFNEALAQALGISISTADRDWSFARAWLYRCMSSGEADSPRAHDD